MESKDSIKKYLESVKDHEVKLYSYLYDLVDKPLSVDDNFLEDIYSGFLNDSRSEIRRISIYALLFFLKVKKERYKLIALQWIKDRNNGDELRLFCMAGLNHAYMGSRNPELLSLFFNIFSDLNNDEDIRTEGFVGMMKVLGLSTVEIMKKNQNRLIISFDDIDIENFYNEMGIIHKLVKPAPNSGSNSAASMQR